MTADAGLILIVLSVLFMAIGPVERILHHRRNQPEPHVAAPIARAYLFPAPEPTLDELVIEAEAALASAALRRQANGVGPRPH